MVNDKSKKEWLEKVTLKLNNEKKEIQRQIEHLKKNDPFSDPDHANDNAAVDTDVREQTAHDTIEAEIEALQNRMTEVGEALNKVEKGQYGYCARCGKDINPARLELVPEAQYCVECENHMKQ